MTTQTQAPAVPVIGPATTPESVKTALLSVFHKDGIVEFARELEALGIYIYASGGTARHLTEAGIHVRDVAELVGGNAILGHRVVTLSREVHAGLLARRIEDDEAEMARRSIPFVDLVCVDLYPLIAEIGRPGSTFESVVDKTDIGGPTMLRSAAKGRRIVVCDPADREKAIKWLKAGVPDDAFVEALCAKAEYIVAEYCGASAAYRSGGNYAFLGGTKVTACKYGENAWQTPAALYSTGSDDPLALDKFQVIEGMAPSFINWTDVDRLLQTMTHIIAALEKNGIGYPTVALGVKHGNCCGACVDPIMEHRTDALHSMMRGDPLAIFGGVIMTNFTITDSCAELLSGKLLDGIIAPGIYPVALDRLRRKKDKCRFIVNKELGRLQASSLDTGRRFRHVRGGFLVEPNYTYVLDLNDQQMQAFSKLPDDRRLDLVVAWAIGSTSNSNTITLVKDGMLIGNGIGQQDRVGAANLAIARAERSGHSVKGAVAYSDSFFPFDDGPKKLIEAGVSAILTSSASVRDKDTVSACVNAGVSLYMIPDAIGRGFFGH